MLLSPMLPSPTYPVRVPLESLNSTHDALAAPTEGPSRRRPSATSLMWNLDAGVVVPTPMLPALSTKTALSGDPSGASRVNADCAWFAMGEAVSGCRGVRVVNP